MTRVQDTSTRKAQGKRLPWRWLSMALLVLLVVVIAWLEPDEEDLFELCSTQGKPTIYRTDQAEGYFDGLTDNCWGCWRYLRNTDYEFIEFSLSKRRLDFDPIREPGIYRVSRIQAGSPECHAELTAYYTKSPMMREEFERNNWCFKVERYESRQARYGYYYQDLGVVSYGPVTGSAIRAQKLFYLDHATDELLAETTNYSLRKYPYIRFSSFGSEKHCNTFKDELGMRDLRGSEIIVPVKEREE